MRGKKDQESTECFKKDVLISKFKRSLTVINIK